jgi:hypothetical protein
MTEPSAAVQEKPATARRAAEMRAAGNRPPDPRAAGAEAPATRAAQHCGGRKPGRASGRG